MDTSVAVPLLVASHPDQDGLVALAAREHGAVPVPKDARARSTYEALGVTVEILVTGEIHRASEAARRPH